MTQCPIFSVTTDRGDFEAGTRKKTETFRILSIKFVLSVVIRKKGLCHIARQAMELVAERTKPNFSWLDRRKTDLKKIFGQVEVTHASIKRGSELAAPNPYRFANREHGSQADSAVMWTGARKKKITFRSVKAFAD